MSALVEFWQGLQSLAFLRSALLASLLAALACGLIGPYVVVKRMSFIAGGISHAVLAGMGAAVFWGFAPFSGALVAALLAALLMGAVRGVWRAQEDSLIGAMWAVGMAVGVLFIAKTPGYQADLLSFLFGSVLLVSDQALAWMAALDGLLLVLVLGWHRQFLALCFDEEFAHLRGLPVGLFYVLLLLMAALTTVVLIQVVGLIMVLALLTLPAAVAGHFVHSLGRMMLVASLAGALSGFLGLVAAFDADLPAGPAIVLAAAALFVVSVAVSRLGLAGALGRGVRRGLRGRW